MYLAYPMYCHQAFGVSIESDLELPELLESEKKGADLVIRFGNVDRFDSQLSASGRWFCGELNALRFDVDGVGRFLVENGASLTIDPCEGADESDLRLFVLGSGMGAVLMQRGFLSLHGSSVVVDGLSVAFLGDCGAGKSTLATALGGKGFPLLTDDLCMISVEDGLFVQSGYPQNKLWPDSLEKLAFDRSNFKRVRGAEEKRALPVQQSAFHASLCPLGRIFVLDSDGEDFSVSRLSGSEALARLLACRYRPYFASEMGLQKREFEQLVELVKVAQISLLSRPKSSFDLESTASLVLNELGF